MISFYWFFADKLPYSTLIPLSVVSVWFVQAPWTFQKRGSPSQHCVSLQLCLLVQSTTYHLWRFIQNCGLSVHVTLCSFLLKFRLGTRVTAGRKGSAPARPSDADHFTKHPLHAGSRSRFEPRPPWPQAALTWGHLEGVSHGQ